MEIFDYVMIVISLIVGLGLAQLLSGIGELALGKAIGHDPAKPYWIHLLWVAYVFLYLIFFWWFQFNLQRVETWSFPLFSLEVCYAVLIFLLCFVLFPGSKRRISDYKTYFFAARKWFFGLLITVFLVDFVDTAIKGRSYLVDLGLEWALGKVLMIAFLTYAIVTTNKRFHAWFVVLVLMLQVFFILRSYLFLG